MDLNQENYKESFLRACVDGDLEYVKIALSNGFNPSFGNSSCKKEPIYIACGYGGHLDIVIELLNHGIDIESNRCDIYNSPLSISIDYGNHDITRELIKRGASIEDIDIDSYELLDSEKDIVRDILEGSRNIKPAKR
jgi:ankyrin repeat protein